MGKEKHKLVSRMPDGRLIYGAAAQQHIIKEDGGWDEHHKKFAKTVIDSVMDKMYEEQRKSVFTVINGYKKAE